MCRNCRRHGKIWSKNQKNKSGTIGYNLIVPPFIMEYTGFEPVASTMRMLRAPNCANTPYLLASENRFCGFPHGNNGARTHDLPLVRRALSRLSYVSVWVKFITASAFQAMPLMELAGIEPASKNPSHVLLLS